MLRENVQQALLQSPKSFPFVGLVLFRFPENRSKGLFPGSGKAPAVASTLRRTQTGNTEGAIWYNAFGK